MNCEYCQELLHTRERGGLPPETQAPLAAHLHDCADCKRAAGALHDLQALLDQEVDASPGLRSQVLARLDREHVLRRAPTTAFGAWFARLWPSRPLGAFSYSLALVLCGMFGGQLLPVLGTDVSGVSAERLYQLCPVPDGPDTAIL